MSITISAALVKELRESTGVGMMECKKALEMSGGDMERAIEELRKSGAAKASKKAGRIAAEGIIFIATDDNHCAAMVEVNCETDFVARDGHFTSFVKSVAETALRNKIDSLDRLASQPLQDNPSLTVEEARQALIAKLGENVQIRRIYLSQSAEATIGAYLHGSRIGVVVELDGGDKELARDIAMHIAASKPLVVSPELVSEDITKKEIEIYTAQAATSGKPADIIEKMVAGRLKKYLDEISLTGQSFIKDPDTTVGALLNKHRVKVLAFCRYEVGEGIEKVVEDFRESVMAQARGE